MTLADDVNNSIATVDVNSRAVAALRLLVGKKAKKARRRLKGAKAPPFFQEPF